jgi:hypothetical protein
MLWQGGFLFYASVVVPIGTDLLGGARAQGVITARVTEWLNLAGLVCLGLLGGLWFLHLILDYFMDPAGRVVQMREPFRVAHGAYLWVSTAHWLMGLALAWLTLAAWRAEDRKYGERPA